MAHDWKYYLQLAVDHFKSQHRLAVAMSKYGVACSQAKISWLLVKADQLSAEDALAIHRATDGQVTASQLRPDLWPTDQHVPNKHLVDEHEKVAS